MVLPVETEKFGKDDEVAGLGCALEMFSEHKEVFDILDNLKNVVNLDRSVQEGTYEKFLKIVTQYIEQPHLIDSHISLMLEKFIFIVRDHNNTMDLKHLAFKYMFIVINVRGYKEVVKHLPHEVADFDHVLRLLEMQDANDSDTWTTRYILLLWLSIIVILPFHMSRFDGLDEDSASERPTVMSRVINLIKTYAVVSDKCRDATALLAAKFITRKDVKDRHLSSFFDWAIESSTDPESSVFVKYGTLACVAAILKHGKRADLLPHAGRLLVWLVSEIERENRKHEANGGIRERFGNRLPEKMVFKIIQRIGMIFLSPRVTPWRYTRGHRSLTANLSSGDNKTELVDASNTANEAEEIFEVPDEVTDVVGQLIEGLRSADSVARWSAAKGIGRITGRLPKEYADMVVGSDEDVGSILDLFKSTDEDAWHGGCLALAELGRRGLLLPNRLPEVVPVILKALVYEEPRGYAAVGSNIRDAACYVCWSFARAFKAEDLQPFVNDIASTLLVVSCFDREINCRRAASAAFQENVGRQGTFPHGIDILTTADFFAVSVRNNAYLQISVFIAQYKEYVLPLIDHLILRKVDHWDCNIREVTAKALHNLTSKDPAYMVDSVLPVLFEKACTIDLNSRHGAVLAIGQIFLALSHLRKNKQTTVELTPELLNSAKSLIPYYRERLYFRGLGGEVIKQACADFIENCSLASLPFHNQDVIDDWLALLNECISYKVQNIRKAAISAVSFLLDEYYSNHEKDATIDALVQKYVSEAKGTNDENNRMGHVLVLGALPNFIIQANVDQIIDTLIECACICPATQRWAESRRDAIRALTFVSSKLVDGSLEYFTQEHARRILEVYLQGLEDYTQDKRGDIGAWVREAAMTGLRVLVDILAEHFNILTNIEMTVILSSIGQQAVEKIDRTRAIAGKIFYSIINDEKVVSYISHHDRIRNIFNECESINWNSAASTFPIFVELVQLPEYTEKLMVGLICSVGGLTETLVKHSSHNLFSFWERQETSEVLRIAEAVENIFIRNQRKDRITVPMLRFLDKLFDSGCISSLVDDDSTDYFKRLMKIVQLEISGCKDIYKLIDAISVLCQFIQVTSVCKIAITQLSILLCHRQPYVRRCTASKFYEYLLMNGENTGLNADVVKLVLDTLSDTDWEKSINEVKPIRNQLCIAMDLKLPVPKKKEAL